MVFKRRPKASTLAKTSVFFYAYFHTNYLVFLYDNHTLAIPILTKFRLITIVYHNRLK